MAKDNSKKKITKESTKKEKHKDITEVYDNSVSVNISLNNLTEKELSKVTNELDKFQKDFKNNISQYYIKTSSNITKKKGKPSLLRDFENII